MIFEYIQDTMRHDDYSLNNVDFLKMSIKNKFI